jgi:hypothetical protein
MATTSTIMAARHLLFFAAEVTAALRFLNKIVRCPHLNPNL